MKKMNFEQMEIVRGGTSEFAYSGSENLVAEAAVTRTNVIRSCALEHVSVWVAAIGWAAAFGTGIGAAIGGVGYGLAYAGYMKCLHS